MSASLIWNFHLRSSFGDFFWKRSVGESVLKPHKPNKGMWGWSTKAHSTLAGKGSLWRRSLATLSAFDFRTFFFLPKGFANMSQICVASMRFPGGFLGVSEWFPMVSGRVLKVSTFWGIQKVLVFSTRGLGGYPPEWPYYNIRRPKLDTFAGVRSRILPESWARDAQSKSKKKPVTVWRDAKTTTQAFHFYRTYENGFVFSANILFWGKC